MHSILAVNANAVTIWIAFHFNAKMFSLSAPACAFHFHSFRAKITSHQIAETQEVPSIRFLFHLRHCFTSESCCSFRFVCQSACVFFCCLLNSHLCFFSSFYCPLQILLHTLFWCCFLLYIRWFLHFAFCVPSVVCACIEIHSLIEYRLSENVKCFVCLFQCFFHVIFILQFLLYVLRWLNVPQILMCFFSIVKDKKTLHTKKEISKPRFHLSPFFKKRFKND